MSYGDKIILSAQLKLAINRWRKDNKIYFHGGDVHLNGKLLKTT